jgi:predicted O-methyltransferase YrrM
MPNHRYNSLDSDPRLATLLRRLHAESQAQSPTLASHVAAHGSGSFTGALEDVVAGREFWRDKMVALEPAKANFCYGLCRSLNARKIVEAGTSFGVSTLYLAAAVRDNGGGIVVATEYEPEKASIAREHFKDAGLVDYIDLREGDLRETLKVLMGPIDFLLVDVWTPLALPALLLVAPLMRRGAIAIADNTVTYRKAYADYFAYLEDPTNGFITQTLPFEGGLEVSIKMQ